MNRITVGTICLLFAVVIGFVLNCFALFLKQWIIASYMQGIGLLPFRFLNEPSYFAACAVMMVIAFIAYIMLVGFFVFALVCFMLKKTKAARTGYTLVTILSVTTAVFQITSFIVTLACQNNYFNSGYWQYQTVGASCYLALASAFFGFVTLALSVFLYRGFKKESKTGEWSDGVQ